MQRPTRRSMLLLGVIGGLVALAEPARASAAPAPTPADAIALRSRFGRAKGTFVTATADAGQFRLRLLDILDLGPATLVEPSRSFNLIFQARSGKQPVEGIYRIHSMRFPATTLLISPIGRGTEAPQLQAVINRSS